MVIAAACRSAIIVAACVAVMRKPTSPPVNLAGAMGQTCAPPARLSSSCGCGAREQGEVSLGDTEGRVAAMHVPPLRAQAAAAVDHTGNAAARADRTVEPAVQRQRPAPRGAGRGVVREPGRRSDKSVCLLSLWTCDSVESKARVALDRGPIFVVPHRTAWAEFIIAFKKK